MDWMNFNISQHLVHFYFTIKPLNINSGNILSGHEATQVGLKPNACKRLLYHTTGSLRFVDLQITESDWRLDLAWRTEIKAMKDQIFDQLGCCKWFGSMRERWSCIYSIHKECVIHTQTYLTTPAHCSPLPLSPGRMDTNVFILSVRHRRRGVQCRDPIAEDLAYRGRSAVVPLLLDNLTCNVWMQGQRRCLNKWWWALMFTLPLLVLVLQTNIQSGLWFGQLKHLYPSFHMGWMKEETTQRVWLCRRGRRGRKTQLLSRSTNSLYLYNITGRKSSSYFVDILEILLIFVINVNGDYHSGLLHG